MHSSISSPRAPRRLLTKILLGFLAVLLVIFMLQRWELNEYAITPGQATNVTPLVSVRGLATDKHHEPVLLVDVYLQQLSMWQYLTFHLQSHVEFIPGSWLEEPGVPTSELITQGYQEMTDSKTAAEVAALRALGWTVTGHGNGAVITSISSNSPAELAGLSVQDRIVSANATPVTSGCGLVRVLHTLPAHSALTLRIVHQYFTATGTLKVGREHTVHLITSAPPSDAAGAGCPGLPGVDASFIGVGLEDGVAYNFPATIGVNTANIGGPSAGLAMTIAIIDDLSKGPLLGGHLVAMTGTMSPNGSVGAVGGVPEKAVAVLNAGAHYFLVPASEVSQARAAVGRRLDVIPVTTLGQALHFLRSIGGSAPVPVSPVTKP